MHVSASFHLGLEYYHIYPFNNFRFQSNKINIAYIIFKLQSRSARAVFQFYPENESQMELLTSQAMKAGFYGGVVIDYPNSAKAKKFFLVLMTGGAAPLPQALGKLTIKFFNDIVVNHICYSHNSSLMLNIIVVFLISTVLKSF